MHKLLLAFMVSAVAAAMAQDSVEMKNAFGWDQGLSYRHYVKKDKWIGCNVSGSYDKSEKRGAYGYTTVIGGSDSVIDSSNEVKDTTEDFSATIKLEAGKELFGYKKLHFDVFVGVGYSYEMSKKYRKEANHFSIKQPTQSVLGFIGFEPRVQLWNRLSVGMRFGLQGEHSWSDYKYNEQNTNASSVQTVVDNTTTYGNSISLFGNVSLTNNLVVLFYF